MDAHLIPSRRAFTGQDAIFRANAEATARRAAGEDVLNLSLGSLMDDSGHLVVLDTVMHLWRDLGPLDVAPYAPIAGDPAYLTALVQRHWPQQTRPGVACATPGGSGALMLSIRNFLEPGMAVLTAAPHWGPYATLTAENGVGLHTAPFPEPGTALDEAAWEAALTHLATTQGRVLLWLNEPCHNPTGHSLDETARLQLLALLEATARRVPVVLLLDLAYLDYTREPAAVRSALDTYARAAEKPGLLVGASLSTSKALTLYGARCGALVFPWSESTALQGALAQSCRGIYSNVTKAGQALMARLARDGKAQESLAAEHAHWSDVLTVRATALDQALVAQGLAPLRWQGGFFVTQRCADPQATDTRLKACGIFGVPIAEGVRLGLCALRAADAPRLAEALASALGEKS